MDGHDEDCRVHYRDYYEPEKVIECECECHEGKTKPKLPEPKMPVKEKVIRNRKSTRTKN